MFEYLKKLNKFKGELEAVINEGKYIDLPYEEKAFFDVLGTDPDIIRSMEDALLIAISKDLAKTLMEHRSHDWDKKEQAQARMRLYIKKVLRKYGYL